MRAVIIVTLALGLLGSFSTRIRAIKLKEAKKQDLDTSYIVGSIIGVVLEIALFVLSLVFLGKL